MESSAGSSSGAGAGGTSGSDSAGVKVKVKRSKKVPFAAIPKIMTFRPTWEQFQAFPAYINYMESVGAHRAGIARVVPPPEYVPRAAGYEQIDLTIPGPISQVVMGKQGIFQQAHVLKKEMTVAEFRTLADSAEFRTPPHADYADLEKKYWQSISYKSPIYGADVSGSLTDAFCPVWNINRLGSILDLVGSELDSVILGVNTSYLYFGMWKATFCWHTEDLELYSINYLHYGAPKTWYGVPPEKGLLFERKAKEYFPESAKVCGAFLRHKTSLLAPSILKKEFIPFDKITQERGDFIITFPFGYHCGFNHGYNIAESTNFAMPRWVEYGKRSVPCRCSQDAVKIDMTPFVKEYQPEQFEAYMKGTDMGRHPEDPTGRVTAAKRTLVECGSTGTKKGRGPGAGSKEDEDEEEEADEDKYGETRMIYFREAMKKAGKIVPNADGPDPSK